MENRAVFRVRRGTNHEWVTKNPILHEGEPSYEEDTGRLKFGDGVTRWVDLDYIIPEKDVKAAIQNALQAGEYDPIVTADLQAHIDSMNPHPVYDDGPSFLLLYQNAKV